MNRRRALIIGWGSIGKQHATSLNELGYDCARVSKYEGSLARFDTIREALEKFNPEYVVVATPTAEHFTCVAQLAEAGFRGRVLVEKPLFERVESFPRNSFSRVAIGYQLRFHPVLQNLKEELSQQRVISCHCYVGQYLPEWRPQTDYRASYSASSARGGGVVRDLSHELDYLLWMFGPARVIKAIGGKYSSLEIDSEDTVGITCSFEKCPVATIQLNYCDRITRRELVITTEGATYVADLRAFTLLKSGDSIRSLNTVPLLNQMHLSLEHESPQPYCSVTESIDVLKFIEEIDKQLK